jgi:hypothetical protein
MLKPFKIKTNYNKIKLIDINNSINNNNRLHNMGVKYGPIYMDYLNLIDSYYYLKNNLSKDNSYFFEVLLEWKKKEKNKDDTYILKYNFIYANISLSMIEYEKKYQLFGLDKSLDILNITTFGLCSEGISYIRKKMGIKHKDKSDIIYLEYYSNSYYGKHFTDKVNNYDSTIQILNIQTKKDFDKINYKKKYDIIYCNVRNYFNDIGCNFYYTLSDMYLLLFNMITSLLLLQEGGTLIFNFRLPRVNYLRFEIIQFLSELFEEFYIDTPENVIAERSYGYEFIGKNFKKLSDADINKLKKLYKQFEKLDPSIGKNFSITKYDLVPKDKIVSTCILPQKRFNYIDSFYPYVTKKNHDLLMSKNFEYESACQHQYDLIDMVANEKFSKSQLQKQQFYSSIMYAKKYDIPLKENLNIKPFVDNFGKEILKNLFTTSLNKIYSSPNIFYIIPSTLYKKSIYSSIQKNIGNLSIMEDMISSRDKKIEAVSSILFPSLTKIKKEVTDKYNGEYCNSVWISIWEILYTFPFLAKSVEQYPIFITCQNITSILCAVNHFIAQKNTKNSSRASRITKKNSNINIEQKNIILNKLVRNIESNNQNKHIHKLQWFANTVNPTNPISAAQNNNITSFHDPFQLIPRFYSNWILGDIKNMEIIDEILDKIRAENIQTVFFDTGINADKDDSALSLWLSEMYLAFQLPLNSNIVIRYYLNLEHTIEVDMLYLLNYLYDNIHIYKQNKNSREIYIIAENKVNEVPSSLLKKMIPLEKILNKKMWNYSFIKVEILDSNFTNIIGSMIDDYIETENKQLYFIDNFSKISKEQLTTINAQLDKNIEKWFELYPVKPISNKYKLGQELLF